MAEKVGNGSSTNPADIKMYEFLIKNIVKIDFTKNMGYFSQRNDFEYTFDLENEFLIASYKHTKKDARGSIIEHGKYNANNVSSKKFLENLISKSNLLNWTDSMMGPLAYDAAYWDMDIYLKCSEKIGMMNGELIAVNDLVELHADSNAAYLVSNHKTQYLREFVVEPLKLFLKDFYGQTNIRLTVKDTYRDKDQQKLQGSSGVGFSEHHTGLLFSFGAVNQSELAKLTSICHEYGFIQRYPTYEGGKTGINNYEECFRYVGVAHATYIYNYNKGKSDVEKLCWEEYVEKLQNDHSFEKEHLTVDTNGDNVADYEIYYVKINDESRSAKIPVPVGMSYTVSGDNIVGVIVTVTLNS